LLRISGHSLRRDPVIAGKDDDWRPHSPRTLGVREASEFDCERLEPAERARRLGQLGLAAACRLTVTQRDVWTFQSDPVSEHVTSHRSALLGCSCP